MVITHYCHIMPVSYGWGQIPIISHWILFSGGLCRLRVCLVPALKEVSTNAFFMVALRVSQKSLCVAAL